MKKFAILVSVVILTMGLVVSAFASNSQADAKALVEKAATFFKSNGKEKALAEFSKSKGTFDKGDLYVFAYDMTATIVAHPKNTKLIGRTSLRYRIQMASSLEKRSWRLQKARAAAG